MKRCPQCKKILFKKRDRKLACPNNCTAHGDRAAFNTVIDPELDRRRNDDTFDTFDPWASAR